ncbi:DnaA regulatory inactivator HdaA [Nitratireductor rhodophyticola]|uniref:DnaA regulatory inactivator HdaA n=1 Tax=Nitratireductor rhodophyticola TaxID=2854036 RepID=UPI002AC8B229|nr:DnaA regulatory inactivator HdaA [Nitratireductor rhodophyticola]WPZ13986.1 DnaA regulatory inactivator HdaA [Nitratireductor rhodophyticola]
MPSRQLPFDLAPGEALSRDDLVVTPANARAAALIENWPSWPAPVVILAGPAGSGKSHLAAIWREEADAAEIACDGIEAAAIEQAGLRPILIDNVDSGPIDENGLFHLINAARAGGQPMLLTARRFPGAWGVKLPDLLSRLKAAATVEIDEPDDMLLAGVITKLFADRQVDVEPHVVQFLVRRIERSLSSAIRVVDAIDRAALERKTRITRPLAAEVVTALEAGENPAEN